MIGAQEFNVIHIWQNFTGGAIYCQTLTLAHNGENDFHKSQFLALGVHSQSWILDNLSKKIFLSSWLVLQAVCYNLTENFFA